MALRDVHGEGIDGKVVRSAEGVRIGTGPSLEKTLLLSPWRWSERLTSFFLSLSVWFHSMCLASLLLLFCSEVYCELTAFIDRCDRSLIKAALQAAHNELTFSSVISEGSDIRVC